LTFFIKFSAKKIVFLVSSGYLYNTTTVCVIIPHFCHNAWWCSHAAHPNYCIR